MKSIRNYFKLFVGALKSFIEEDTLKLCASLSYYTVFSLGPLILLILSVGSLFYGKEAIQGRIFSEIKSLVGNSAAYQIQHILIEVERHDNSTLGAIVGFIMLAIGATGVFIEIQGSINYIWSIKAKPKKGWVKLIVNRILSFSLVVATSFILLVALVINAAINFLVDQLIKFFPESAVAAIYILNQLTIFLVITALFAVIYKVLPDALIAWKDALRGACLSAILFLVGKYLLGFYIGSSKFSSTYGTAASIMVIFVWVYYSSAILYYGAMFTRLYALNYGKGITPNDTAVFIIKSEKKELNTS